MFQLFEYTLIPHFFKKETFGSHTRFQVEQYLLVFRTIVGLLGILAQNLHQLLWEAKRVSAQSLQNSKLELFLPDITSERQAN